MLPRFLTHLLFLILSTSIKTNLFAYTAYFSNATHNTVTVVDTTNNLAIATIPVVSSAYSLAITPNGRYLYVSGLNGNISVIDTSDNTVIDTIVVGNPRHIAISPDGESLYVTNISTTNVNIYSTATNAFLSSIAIGELTAIIAINPAGTLAYVAGISSTIYIVNLHNNSIESTITSAPDVNYILFSTDGTKVYVANTRPGPSDTILVYDATTHTLSNTITVGNYPFSIVSTPNGEFLYVTNELSHTVSVINTESNTVTNTISLASGSGPDGIAITPDGTTLYTANYSAGNSSMINAANNTVTIGVVLAAGLTDVLIAPLATPASLSGSQKINDFGVRYELYNILKWTPSITPATIGYNIYRNGTLIGSTSGINATTYVDHNREEGASYQYSVRSRASNGDLSFPVTVTIYQR